MNLSYSQPEVCDQQLLAWQMAFEQETGIWLPGRSEVLRAGLQRRMRSVEETDSARYLQQLGSGPMARLEWEKLIEHTVINETRFFRDPDTFAFIERWLLQRVKQVGHNRLSLLSAGCASGEEAYSLAMLASDVLQASSHGKRAAYYDVFGIDISAPVLSAARAGQYAAARMANVSANRHGRFFKSLGADRYQVSSALINRTCFLKGRLQRADQLSLPQMDVIVCLNVLLYFRMPTRQHVLMQLLDKLKPGGILVIGHNEMVGWQAPGVTRVAGTTINAYQKELGRTA